MGEFRKIFDTIPEQFDKYRPRYCAELFAELIEYAGVGESSSVLELGPGTGQATEPVLDTGCDYLVLPEQHREPFFEGLRNAVLEAGNRLVFLDTHTLYLAKKPLGA